MKTLALITLSRLGIDNPTAEQIEAVIREWQKYLEEMNR